MDSRLNVLIKEVIEVFWAHPKGSLNDEQFFRNRQVRMKEAYDEIILPLEEHINLKLGKYASEEIIFWIKKVLIKARRLRRESFFYLADEPVSVAKFHLLKRSDELTDDKFIWIQVPLTTKPFMTDGLCLSEVQNPPVFIQKVHNHDAGYEMTISLSERGAVLIDWEQKGAEFDVPFAHKTFVCEGRYHTIKNVSSRVTADLTLKDPGPQIYRGFNPDTRGGLPVSVTPSESVTFPSGETHSQLYPELYRHLQLDVAANPFFEDPVNVLTKLFILESSRASTRIKINPVYPDFQMVSILPWPRSIPDDWSLLGSSGQITGQVIAYDKEGNVIDTKDFQGGDIVLFNNQLGVKTDSFEIRNTSGYKIMFFLAEPAELKEDANQICIAVEEHHHVLDTLRQINNPELVVLNFDWDADDEVLDASHPCSEMNWVTVVRKEGLAKEIINIQPQEKSKAKVDLSKFYGRPVLVTICGDFFSRIACDTGMDVENSFIGIYYHNIGKQVNDKVRKEIIAPLQAAGIEILRPVVFSRSRNYIWDRPGYIEDVFARVCEEFAQVFIGQALTKTEKEVEKCTTYPILKLSGFYQGRQGSLSALSSQNGVRILTSLSSLMAGLKEGLQRAFGLKSVGSLVATFLRKQSLFSQEKSLPIRREKAAGAEVVLPQSPAVFSYSRKKALSSKFWPLRNSIKGFGLPSVAGGDQSAAAAYKSFQATALAPANGAVIVDPIISLSRAKRVSIKKITYQDAEYPVLVFEFNIGDLALYGGGVLAETTITPGRKVLIIAIEKG
ncbi:MAG: hypothetical protein KJ880_00375, partial [Candidatus Omnitrophica bacterium]|nr:hypothetical protein [Candidatus Omnitrophota bacterium]